jgi:hypothetical protein
MIFNFHQVLALAAVVSANPLKLSTAATLPVALVAGGSAGASPVEAFPTPVSVAQSSGAQSLPVASNPLTSNADEGDDPGSGVDRPRRFIFLGGIMQFGKDGVVDITGLQIWRGFHEGFVDARKSLKTLGLMGKEVKRHDGLGISSFDV